jgi:hypothetical protein
LLRCNNTKRRRWRRLPSLLCGNIKKEGDDNIVVVAFFATL